MNLVRFVLFSKKTTLCCVVILIAMLIIPHYINYYVSIDGGYSEWGQWSSCSPSCGQGVKAKTRKCINPVPKAYGKPCDVLGPLIEVHKCNFINCPQNGKWGNWGSWSSCTPNCKDGKRSREMKCDNPPPLYHGKQCEGTAAKMNEKCDHLPPCPINGGLSKWDAWSACSKTCGEGTKNRKRYCNQPEPKYKGKACTGSLHETEKCKVKDCITGKTVNITKPSDVRKPSDAKKPSAVKLTKKTSIVKLTKKTSIVKVTKKPLILKLTKKPSIVNVEKKQSIVKVTKKQSIVKVTKKPATLKVMKKP